MNLHCDCRFGQRGRIHLHIPEICFVFLFLIPVFSFSPCPATSLQCWTGNISCLPPAVNHYLSNTTTDADSSAWLLREDAVLGDKKLISTWRGAKPLLKGCWAVPGISGIGRCHKQVGCLQNVVKNNPKLSICLSWWISFTLGSQVWLLPWGSGPLFFLSWICNQSHWCGRVVSDRNQTIPSSVLCQLQVGVWGHDGYRETEPHNFNILCRCLYLHVLIWRSLDKKLNSVAMTHTWGKNRIGMQNIWINLPLKNHATVFWSIYRSWLSQSVFVIGFFRTQILLNLNALKTELYKWFLGLLFFFDGPQGIWKNLCVIFPQASGRH